ncbi:MAG: phosphoenolpyruvate carboxylase [Pseudomonadota bacterium]
MNKETAPDLASAGGLRAAFAKIVEGAAADPLINPVRTLASRLFLGAEAGALTGDDLRRAISEFERDGFEARAAAFNARRKESAGGADAALDALARGGFERFKRVVGASPAGVVFTAHPTFALTKERRALIADFPDAARKTWRQRVTASRPGAPSAITLEDEHEDVLAAIARAQDAAGGLNARIIETARERFPDAWRKLRPAPVSIASWVGYDLDGRTDIHWAQSVTIRLREKARQLDRYVALLEAVPDYANDADLVAIRDRLQKAAAETHGHADRFSGDLSDPDIVVAAANALTADETERLTSLRETIKTLDRVIEKTSSDNAAQQLMLLRAEMENCGLGVARIHLRVNAAQVRSALRTDLGLDPDKEFSGRSALNIASSKAKQTDARAVNFGSVFLEQMTARRQFMLCAQILKHIDADTPIRFLIAECEAPATVMGAVYLARLYGVEDKLDISPLFETPQALERGGRFIERLLAEPEYVAYVKRRRRMAIQIGYSDSGRFMGQVPASLASERLQVLFGRALTAAGLHEVEALVFNTHGESMGRGAFPGGYEQRSAHLSTPWVRSLFHRDDLNFAAEFSFQGGEGYLHFQTPAIAAKTIEALWADGVNVPPADKTDRYYKDINYSWDVYRAWKGWQENLYARDDYRDVIFSFAQNLLYKTGSREVKRPRSSAGPPEIRSIRAIPHNAILQQLGMPINVAGGVGAAAGREVDRFVEHVAASRRMQRVIAMAEHARDLTSVSVMRAYAGLFSPAYWSSLAGMARRTDRSEVYESVLQVLQEEKIDDAFGRLADFVARDLRAFDAVREQMRALSGDSDETQGGVNGDLGVLHALRQALIGRAAALIASAPAFSRRHDVTRADIIELALSLRLQEAAEIMRRIFPKQSPGSDIIAKLSEKVDDDDAQGGAYPEIHEQIIDPLLEIDDLLHDISAAIANHYGAFG